MSFSLRPLENIFKLHAAQYKPGMNLELSQYLPGTYQILTVLFVLVETTSIHK